MTSFYLFGLCLIIVWVMTVVFYDRTSKPILLGGLALVGLYTFTAHSMGMMSLDDVGMKAPASWSVLIALTLAWTIGMYYFTSVADALSTKIFKKQPTLESFRALQESKAKLVAGIIVAWVLGGFLEELAFRGIVLQAVEASAGAFVQPIVATTLGILVAAGLAGLIHLYQGARAAFIVTQLSVLFGVLFVLCGNNLWAVMVAHGLYDTAAFIRFAAKKSKYSDLSRGEQV